MPAAAKEGGGVGVARRYSILIVGSLTLGIGWSVIFVAALSATLLKPLPYPNADRLVAIHALYDRAGEQISSSLTIAEANSLSAESSSFELVGSVSRFNDQITAKEEPIEVTLGRADHSFFELLGLVPIEGRRFNLEDETQNAAVMLVRADLWRKLFGSSSLADQRIQYRSRLYAVVGVLPDLESPTRLEDAQVWIPLSVTTRMAKGTVVPAIARLKPGVGPEAASEEVSSLLHQRQARGRVVALKQQLFASIREPLIALTGASLLLLAIMCLNTINLVVLRASTHRRNFAVRRALGASRISLFGIELRKHLVLAAIGSLLAMFGASGAATVLRSLLPVSALRLDHVRIVADGGWFLLVIPTVMAVLLSVVAFYVGTVFGPQHSLLATTHSNFSRYTSRIRGPLLSAEVAVVLVLAHSAILLAASFATLSSVDPGFDYQGVTSMTLSFPIESARNDSLHLSHIQEILERGRRLRHMRSVGIASSFPFVVGRSERTILPEGYVFREGESDVLHFTLLDVEYMKTLGIRVTAGRIPEVTSPARVALVNQEYVKRFVPQGSGVGHFFSTSDQQFEVAAVVQNMKQMDLTSAPYAEVYFLLGQMLPPRTLLVRTHLAFRAPGHEQEILKDLRNVIESTVPGTKIVSTQRLGSLILGSIRMPRFWSIVIGTIGLIGLVMAAIGVYGVASLYVGSRRFELAIKSALGAPPKNLSISVLKDVFKYVGFGTLGGLLIAQFSGTLLSSLLYGVEPTSIAILGSVALLMALIATIGSWMPTTQASRLDPSVVLRWE